MEPRATTNISLKRERPVSHSVAAVGFTADADRFDQPQSCLADYFDGRASLWTALENALFGQLRASDGHSRFDETFLRPFARA